MNPMQAVVTALVSAANFMVAQVSAVIGRLWSGILGMADFLFAWLVTFFVNLVGFLVEALIAGLTVLVGWFPDMPAPPALGGTGFLDTANRYAPVSEAAALGAIWVAIFIGVLLYKAGKFLRGGG